MKNDPRPIGIITSPNLCLETTPPRESVLQLKLHERLTLLDRKSRLESLRWSQAPETIDQVRKLWGLGPRILAEYFAAVGAANDCMPGIASHLSAYSQLPPKTVEALGADRFVPRRPLLVPETEFPEGAP